MQKSDCKEKQEYQKKKKNVQPPLEAHRALSFPPCFSQTMSTKGIETRLCMLALDNSDPFVYGYYTYFRNPGNALTGKKNNNFRFDKSLNTPNKTSIQNTK